MIAGVDSQERDRKHRTPGTGGPLLKSPPASETHESSNRNYGFPILNSSMTCVWSARTFQAS
jgi:hypothetical protein